ncbi:hypothetical protein [Streptomyces sp. NBC_00306]|uniref:hypothetical protein n=1 Tax=Streptomyces sp. NBC_00306 TaxID=2975708 RepID=UPI002E2E7EA6|nr:hypothetical protein [Streptomyces sp. NBC_00306]
MCRAARWLGQHLGRRGTFLAILGIGKTCFGVGFIVQPPSTRGLELLTDRCPLSAWAWVWILAGLVTFASAWLRIGRDGYGFIAAMIPPALWATAYTSAVFTGAFPRGGFIAVWYLTAHVGVIMWASTVPEHSVPPAPRRARKGGAP